MAAVLGRVIGKELVDVLGLPERTRRVELIVDVDEVVTVKCWYYHEEGNVSRFPQLMQRYQLMAEGEPEEVEGARNDLPPMPADPEFDGLPLLTPDNWELERDGDYVIAGIYEGVGPSVHWRRLALSDLPNQVITPEDLERHGITLGGDDLNAG